MNSADKKTIITSTPSNVNSAQSEFSKGLFDDAINDKGYKCYHEAALRCACINKTSGQGDSDCVNCGGSGWFHIDKKSTVVLSTALSNRTKYEVWTKENMGTVNMTFKAEDRIGFMDKVTLLELEAIFTENKTLRKNNAGDKYFSFLIYNPLLVYEVYICKESNLPLVFVDAANYTIEDNKIVFTKDYIETTLGNSMRMVIRYNYNPVYYIIDINRDLRKNKTISGANGVCLPDGVTSLESHYPIACIGRRAHYVLDAPNFAGEFLVDNTNYDREPTKYNG